MIVGVFLFGSERGRRDEERREREVRTDGDRRKAHAPDMRNGRARTKGA